MGYFGFLLMTIVGTAICENLWFLNTMSQIKISLAPRKQSELGSNGINIWSRTGTVPVIFADITGTKQEHFPSQMMLELKSQMMLELKRRCSSLTCSVFFWQHEFKFNYVNTVYTRYVNDKAMAKAVKQVTRKSHVVSSSCVLWVHNRSAMTQYWQVFAAEKHWGSLISSR